MLHWARLTTIFVNEGPIGVSSGGYTLCIMLVVRVDFLISNAMCQAIWPIEYSEGRLDWNGCKQECCRKKPATWNDYHVRISSWTCTDYSTQTATKAAKLTNIMTHSEFQEIFGHWIEDRDPILFYERPCAVWLIDENTLDCSLLVLLVSCDFYSSYVFWTI